MVQKKLKMKNFNKSNLQQEFNSFVCRYTSNLMTCFTEEMNVRILNLAQTLQEVWKKGDNVFICGNGGSAGNAIHIANDFIYGTANCGKGITNKGLKVNALTANPAVLTCLGNDIGYDNIFSYQLDTLAGPNDILIALSGSGNSSNIVSAINTAKQKGLETFAILAFDGGKCKEIVDHPMHFEICDMQIAEDIQLIIGHLCMQWLSNNKPQLSE